MRPPELPHRGQVEERLVQGIVVSRAGRRLGVVFGEAQRPAAGSEEEIQPGRGAVKNISPAVFAEEKLTWLALSGR